MSSVLKAEQTLFCFSSYGRLPSPLPGVAAWPQLNLGLAGITAGMYWAEFTWDLDSNKALIGRC